MVEDKEKQKEVVDLNVESSKKICGMDCGTMNVVCATQDADDNIETKTIRNMYLPLDKSQVAVAELSNIDFIESEDMIYIIGEDSYRYANIFGSPVKRPMSKGLISPDEIDAIDVLTLILSHIVGKTYDGVCVYSIPAESIDVENNITYHEGVFGRIFSELGYKSKSFNEAMAIIYNECKDTQFSGLSISFGAGMTNVCLAWKTTPVLTFSVGRGGDWIDENVAMSLGTVPNRVTSIKEKSVDLSDFRVGSKREVRVREAIIYYYRSLIQYVIEKMIYKLKSELSNVDLPDELPIIVSGGTSLATGFLDLFSEVVNSTELPFDVMEIRQASDPMTCVAEGLLIRALMETG